MPGPVSDSYDPEFGTAENASCVRESLKSLLPHFEVILGSRLQNVVELARGPEGPRFNLRLSERKLRLLRFAIRRAIESV